MSRPDFDDGPTPTAWVALSTGRPILALCEVGLARASGIGTTSPACGDALCCCTAPAGETFRAANEVEMRAAFDTLDGKDSTP